MAADRRRDLPAWAAGGVLILTLAGTALRLYALGRPSLWIDEGFTAVRALAMKAHGVPLLPDGSVSWAGAALHAGAALALRATGDLHLGVRLVPALAGCLLIPVFLWGNCSGSRPKAGGYLREVGGRRGSGA
jgi:predicted membrane-bound mannosyltransferase